MIPTATLADRLREEEDALRGMVPAETVAAFSADAERMSDAYRGQGLRVGDDAPDFRLPDATGNVVALADLLAKGPVVVTFYRGAWCPYCNVQLHAYGEALPKIEAAGATLVAISPQKPDESLTLAEKHGLAFPVLSDAGNAVARGYVPVFTVADAPLAAQRKLGLTISDGNADGSNELPVPGTFVVDREGKVRFAFVEGDYRTRLEPSEILNALKQL